MRVWRQRRRKLRRERHIALPVPTSAVQCHYVNRVSHADNMQHHHRPRRLCSHSRWRQRGSGSCWSSA
jgi:hypothetical protein